MKSFIAIQHEKKIWFGIHEGVANLEINGRWHENFKSKRLDMTLLLESYQRVW